jgi:peptide-methionine (S)-S-oxide reductase
MLNLNLLLLILFNCYLKSLNVKQLTFLLFALFLVTGCKSNTTKISNQMDISANGIKTDTATFAAGCFWCVEAVFQELKGVLSVTSGYTGGKIKNPSYSEVCSGITGHAEACQIIYNPTVISYDELLEAFWASHDPTTLNRQGADQGTQYRSAIFYHNEQQKKLAEAYKAKLNSEKVFDKPVVTEITQAGAFYKAEDYHQNYFNENGNAPYCTFVIVPKLEKFRKVFKDKLK